MMKELYTAPEIELMYIADDVIRTSPIDGGNDFDAGGEHEFPIT